MIVLLYESEDFENLNHIFFLCNKTGLNIYMQKIPINYV